MKRKALAAFPIVILGLASGAMVFADSTSPIGLWKTIDDETKDVKSIVRISEKDARS